MNSRELQPSALQSKQEEKHITIPCKYFHTIKECRRGSKCWFSHDKNHTAEKKSKKNKQNLNKKFKDEHNIVKESEQEQGANMQQIMKELLKILLRERNI